MSYKWCVVPACRNTSIKTPKKLFVCVPKNAKKRKKWLQLARRNPDDIKDNSMAFVCVDHFDMEKDMANYCQYKMGFSQRIIMVNGVLPSKFNYQQDHKKRMCGSSTSRHTFAKYPKTQLTQECGDNTLSTETVEEVITSEAQIIMVKLDRELPEKIDHCDTKESLSLDIDIKDEVDIDEIEMSLPQVPVIERELPELMQSGEESMTLNIETKQEVKQRDEIEIPLPMAPALASMEADPLSLKSEIKQEVNMVEIAMPQMQDLLVPMLRRKCAPNKEPEKPIRASTGKRRTTGTRKTTAAIKTTGMSKALVMTHLPHHHQHTFR